MATAQPGVRFRPLALVGGKTMIVAQRVPKFHIGDREVDVPVRIHLPVDKNDHWQCDYEIDWPAALRKSAARGIDSLQALLMAMHKIGVEIYNSDAHRSGKLRLDRPGGGYGFPLPREIRDLYEGDDKEM
jgi:uncharacterized protein DUF6968